MPTADSESQKRSLNCRPRTFRGEGKGCTYEAILQICQYRNVSPGGSWSVGAGREISSRRNGRQILNLMTRARSGACPVFGFAFWARAKKARRAIDGTRRFVHRGLAGLVRNVALRCSACGGLSLFLGFSGDRSFHGGARRDKARGRGKHVGDGRFGFREQSGDRVNQRVHQLGGRQGRGLQGLVVIEHPPGEQRLRGLLYPLIHKRGDFLTQIRGVIEACEFITLQRSARSRLQIVERRSEPRYGHGQSSNLRAGPKGPATEIICAQY
jgi:hypothetical protein